MAGQDIRHASRLAIRTVDRRRKECGFVLEDTYPLRLQSPVEDVRLRDIRARIASLHRRNRLPRDAALKRFALNTDLLWHLLRACPLDGLDGAQIANIKPASANLIGPDLSQRLPDAAWRIELRDGSLACLLLECQAEPDPTMPFRALHSVATLALKLSRDPPQGCRRSCT